MNSHKTICEKIFSLAGGCQAEALASSSDSSLTRFADNVISQNVSNTATDMYVNRPPNRPIIGRFEAPFSNTENTP